MAYLLGKSSKDFTGGENTASYFEAKHENDEHNEISNIYHYNESGEHSYSVEDKDAFREAFAQTSKASFLEKKEQKWNTSIRDSAKNLNYDHIVFSLSQDETKALDGQERSLITAIHNAITEYKGLNNHAQGSLFTHTLQVHKDTDNTHVHILVNKHAINSQEQKISNAEKWCETGALRKLSELIDKNLSELGVNLTTEAHRRTSDDKNKNTTTVEQDLEELSGYKALQTQAQEQVVEGEGLSQFNALTKSLTIERTSLQQQLTALAHKEAVLEKAKTAVIEADIQAKQVKELESNVSTLTQTVEEQTTHITSLTKETHSQSETIEQFTAQNEKLSGELETTKESAKTLQADLDDANNEVSELVEELALASETIAVKQNEIIGLKEDNQSAHNDLLAVEKALEQVNISFEVQAKLTDEANDKVKTLQTDNTTLATTNTNLKAELESSRDKFDKQLSEQRAEFMKQQQAFMEQQQAFMEKVLAQQVKQQAEQSGEKLDSSNAYKMGVAGATISKANLKSFVDKMGDGLELDSSGTVVKDDGELLFKASSKNTLLVNNKSVNASETAVTFIQTLGGHVSSLNGDFKAMIDVIKESIDSLKMSISNTLKKDLSKFDKSGQDKGQGE